MRKVLWLYRLMKLHVERGVGPSGPRGDKTTPQGMRPHFLISPGPLGSEHRIRYQMKTKLLIVSINVHQPTRKQTVIEPTVSTKLTPWHTALSPSYGFQKSSNQLLLSSGTTSILASGKILEHQIIGVLNH